MSGSSKKSGFTIIELMVVLFIIGLIAAITIPNLRRNNVNVQRKEFVDHIQDFLSRAWRQAISENKTHRLFFDFKKRILTIEHEEGFDSKGEPVFKSISTQFGPAQYQWSEFIEIKQFFVEGVNDMARTDRTVVTLWFYIIDEGTSQSVIINFVDKKQKNSNAGKEMPGSLVINPFSAQLKEYDTFQQP